MRIKKGFILHEVLGQHIVNAIGEECMDFNKLISLNESAAVIWNAVAGKDFTVQDMVAALTSEYDVDENTARLHSEAQLRHWQEQGLIEAIA